MERFRIISSGTLSTVTMVLLGCLTVFLACLLAFKHGGNENELAHLVPGDIKSLSIGHTTIADTSELSKIVNLLNSAQPFRADQVNFNTTCTGGPALSLDTQDGKHLQYYVLKYFVIPGSALLESGDNQYLLVKNFSYELERRGLHLPKDNSGLYFKEEEQTFNLADLHPNLGPGISHTLFSIEQVPLKKIFKATVYPQHALDLLFAVVLIVTIYIVVSKRPVGSNSVGALCLSCLIFGALTLAGENNAFKYSQSYDKFLTLQKLLVSNECKTCEGTLQSVSWYRVGHNPIVLHNLEIDGKKFYFSNNKIDTYDEAFYSSGGWLGWAAEQLQPGERVRVWYDSENAKETIARIDIL